MRDPKRIRRMLTLLEHYWFRYPDLRLGQIVGNFTRGSDPYYVEDEAIMAEIEAALNAETMRVESADA